jgi:hypothetical protein
MNQVVFDESDATHADRLGVSLAFVRTRRALLIERLGGQPVAERELGFLPARVRQASAATLMATLDVQVMAPGSRRGGEILLVPLIPATETA